MAKRGSRRVYSTDDNEMERIRQMAKAAQRPVAVKSLPPEQQLARLHRDRKGRGGKVVTLVKDLVLSEKDMKALAKTLKKKCGTGGAVKNGVIEIQGDVRERISAELQKLGYKNQNRWRLISLPSTIANQNDTGRRGSPQITQTQISVFQESLSSYHTYYESCSLPRIWKTARY